MKLSIVTLLATFPLFADKHPLAPRTTIEHKEFKLTKTQACMATIACTVVIAFCIHSILYPISPQKLQEFHQNRTSLRKDLHYISRGIKKLQESHLRGRTTEDKAILGFH